MNARKFVDERIASAMLTDGRSAARLEGLSEEGPGGCD
jgi:hypothetical protein